MEFLEKIKDFFVGLALNFADSFHQNFIADNRWKYLTNGLATTLVITAGALALGVVLGFCWRWSAPPTIRPGRWDFSMVWLSCILR